MQNPPLLDLSDPFQWEHSRPRSHQFWLEAGLSGVSQSSYVIFLSCWGLVFLLLERLYFKKHGLSLIFDYLVLLVFFNQTSFLCPVARPPSKFFEQLIAHGLM